MISHNIFIPLKTRVLDPVQIEKGTWLCLLHTERIPPHAGMIFNGNYNSLTIREAELNLDCALLLETITRKKIKSVFIKIVPHPVFSLNHQLEMFQEELKKSGFVKQGQATCLSPLKSFFNEFYALNTAPEDLLFDVINQLVANNYIDFAMAANTKTQSGIELPFYTREELDEKIKAERQLYFND